MRGTRVERGGYEEKTVEDFKYLGSTVQCNGERRKELVGPSGEKCQVRCVTEEYQQE